MTSAASIYPHLLTADTPYHSFPDPNTALTDPDGLLAIGGDLHPQRILHAYHQGIFPWYNEDQPILWWSPNPRCILYPDNLKISRSLKKSIKNKGYRITFNQSFNEVIRACAAPRRNSGLIEGEHTWLSEAMIHAYNQLHSAGHAHSAECWHKGTLIGGLYGIKLGQIFYGESMFQTQTDASKVAFVAWVEKLIQEGCQLIDCQLHSAHIASLGAEEIPRSEFLKLLNKYGNP